MKIIALLAVAALALAAPQQLARHSENTTVSEAPQLLKAAEPAEAPQPEKAPCAEDSPKEKDSKSLKEKDIEIIVAVLLAFFFPLSLFWIRRRCLTKSPDDAAHAANIGEEKGLGDARRIPAVAGTVGATGGVVDAGV
ncbi:hypothetical protein CKM354_001202700 [Cercospora kikuchii]|uniref:Uncharacterized protein n=1 Tax=Cercospora kikuchii TaxID=84275 RepID=A0A9P3CU50_9PEZI|nr:uncharacterized protein CKM354_001202700 [Cercospora kikuchii]GIZ48986.1 hypothetical protein CKM354_001202700 [Cercospora kikuchii]